MPKGLRAKVPQHVREALKEQAVRGKVKEPDLARLVNHFFDVCGGERAVASLLYGEFCHAGEGSLVRQRILDLIMRCLGKVNQGREPEDTAGLTEEELMREFHELVAGASDDATDPAALQPATPPGGQAGAAPGPAYPDYDAGGGI